MPFEFRCHGNNLRVRKTMISMTFLFILGEDWLSKKEKSAFCCVRTYLLILRYRSLEIVPQYVISRIFIICLTSFWKTVPILLETERRGVQPLMILTFSEEERETGLGRISPYAVGPALILDFITSTQIQSCPEHQYSRRYYHTNQ